MAGTVVLKRMLRAFAGLASPNGLEALYSENDHVVRFLVRRAYRKTTVPRVCFWAVMDDSLACAIELLLEQGQQREALMSVCLLSEDFGPICPPDPAEPVFSQA